MVLAHPLPVAYQSLIPCLVSGHQGRKGSLYDGGTTWASVCPTHTHTATAVARSPRGAAGFIDLPGALSPPHYARTLKAAAATRAGTHVRSNAPRDWANACGTKGTAALTFMCVCEMHLCICIQYTLRTANRCICVCIRL